MHWRETLVESKVVGPPPGSIARLLRTRDGAGVRGPNVSPEARTHPIPRVRPCNVELSFYSSVRGKKTFECTCNGPLGRVRLLSRSRMAYME